MIYTVTLNPAVDYVVHAPSLITGSVNRTEGEAVYFGGKGINVARILHRLGQPVTALGFAAGFTGRAIERGLKAEGVKTDFIHLKNGFSRINIKIKGSAETELNGAGPSVSPQALRALYRKISALKSGDVLVLSGSVPPALPCDIYERLLSLVAGKEVQTAVDATGNLLLGTLSYKPYLIKPNHHELGSLFGTTVTSAEQAVFYAQKLHEAGALYVLVSMAEKGAVLIDAHGKVHFCAACRGEAKNSVGAGDSMVGGFLAGITTGDCAYALKLGTAAGGATAFSDDLADKDAIFKQLNLLSS